MSGNKTNSLRTASAPVVVETAATAKSVRIGTQYDSTSNKVKIVAEHDTLIYIEESGAGDTPSYFVAMGQTDGDTVAGSAEYIADQAEVRLRTGWAYASGIKPHIRTKRVRGRANQTTLLGQVVSAAAPADPEDGDHLVYFLDPTAGQAVDVELVDTDETVLAAITLECTANPPADTKARAYVVPGRECYVVVPPDAKELDATKDVVKEPAGTEPADHWTGAVGAFLTDVRARVAAMVP